MKKLAALVVILILGFLPQGILTVLATYQVANTNFRIINLSPIAGDTYNLTFTWIRPPEPSLQYTGGGVDVGDGRATDYRVFMRNATLPGGFGTEPIALPIATLDDPVVRSFPADFPFAPPMQNGRIYMFQVQPTHYHQYTVGNTVTTAPAPLVPGGQPFSEFGFMTDINVSAIGSGDVLTVTWDNPLFNGQEIFTHYRIWYTLRVEGAFPVNTASVMTVWMEDPALIRNSDGTVSFAIHDTSLQINEIYSVIVEPMLSNTVLLRGGNLTSMIALPDGTTREITFTSRYFRTDNAVVRPMLTIVEEDAHHIRLTWSPLTRFGQELISIVIQQSPIAEEGDAAGSEFWSTIGNITAIVGNDLFVRDSYNWVIPTPTTNVRFRVLITHAGSNDPIQSEEAVWMQGHVEFRPYMPTIFSVEQQGGGSLAHTLVWEAFLRRPFTSSEIAESNEDGLFLDLDMEYDIWISNSLDNINSPLMINNPTLPAEEAVFLPRNINFTHTFWDEVTGEQRTRTTTAFSRTITEYSTIVDGMVVTRPFQENAVYYVKIVARRPHSGEISQAVTYAWYVPPINNVPTNPLAMATPPLTLASVGTDEFEIQWNTRWFEIYNPDTETWHTVVGYNNGIVFGGEASQLSNSLHLYHEAVIPSFAGNHRALWTAGANEIFHRLSVLSGIPQEELRGRYAIRFLDLQDSEYAIHVAQFDTMMAAGGFAEYYRQNLYPFSQRINAWQAPISSLGAVIRPTFTVTQEDAPNIGGLTPNTAYIVYFIAYSVVGDEILVASHPSFLSVTTQTDRDELVPDPTVPSIRIIDTTDMSVTVQFIFEEGITYELRYAHMLSAYPAGGTVISHDQILETGTFSNEQDSAGNSIVLMTFEITGLFPETRHYFWIRAQSGAQYRWSSAVDTITDDVETPLPPQGLGIASAASIGIFNAENDTSYTSTSDDHIVLEWMRDPNDSFNPVLETTNGSIAHGEHQELVSTSLRFTRMIKFNELVPNRSYFARARTTVVVTIINNEVVRYYLYTIQLSNSPDFINVVEITVPSVVPTNDANFTIIRQSGWGDYVVIHTERTDEEYDGNVNPDLLPLPADDFEITFDSDTETLTWRFRSDHPGDRNVDQRFISRLVQSGEHGFSIDLTRYGDRDINNRVVEIPFSILQTFDERRIDLQVVAGNMAITLRPGWTSTMELANIHDFGSNATVTLLIEEQPTGIDVLPNGTYASMPHRVSARVQTPTRTVNMQYTAVPVRVDLGLQNRALEFDRNVGAYTFTAANAAWNHVNSNLDSLAGVRSMEVTQFGTYALIALDAPQVVEDNSAIASAMHSFNSRMTITDMSMLQPNSIVHAVHLGNVVVAIAERRSSFEMEAMLSQDSIASLVRTNMFVSGMQVTREQGISVLVNLYERATNTRVNHHQSLETTMFPEIIGADPANHNNLLRAEALGFFMGETNARLQDYMTMGELIFMADAILQDANI